MALDQRQLQRLDALRTKAQGTRTPLIQTDRNGRRRTCRYVSGPYDERCTGTPVGSEDAEITLCVKHLRRAIELISAERITL